MYQEILNEDITIEELRPDIRENFKIGNKGIVLQVGASDRIRVCSPKVMSEYLKEIKKLNPEETITLIGYGETQLNYSLELERLLPNIELINLVNKTNLVQAFKEVAKSEMYIGFDSGYYNFAFSIKKPILAIFQSDEQKGFKHSGKNIKILTPKEENIKKCKVEDKLYPNKRMSSIPVEEFLGAYKELINIRIKGN